MINSTYTRRLQEFVDNIRYKELAYKLAEANNIQLEQIYDYLPEYNYQSIYMYKGGVKYFYPSWMIIIHEICHILSVEPELRHLMTGDTVKSYREINKQYPINKEMRRESVTLGLNHMILEHFLMSAAFYGDFFNGKVGIGAIDIKPEWIDKAKELNINFKDIKIKPNLILDVKDLHTTPDEKEPLLILYYDDKSDYNIDYGYFNTDKDIEIYINNLYAWSYI